MTIRLLGSFLLIASLAACGVPPGGGKKDIYWIPKSQDAAVQYRMLDSINAVRKAAGVRPVVLNPLLTAAAATHARDVSIQNRAWDFGSDGSSPIDRVARTGYKGRLLGEAVAKTYETETSTLAAWLGETETRDVVLDKRARAIGFAWHQDPSGKLWYVLDVAS